MQCHSALHNAAGVTVELIDTQTFLDMLMAITTTSLLVAQLLDRLMIENLDDIQYELLIVTQEYGFPYHALGKIKRHIDWCMYMNLDIRCSMESQMSSSSYAIILILCLRYLSCLVRVERETNSVLCWNRQKLIAAVEDLVEVAALNDQLMTFATKLYV